MLTFGGVAAARGSAAGVAIASAAARKIGLSMGVSLCRDRGRLSIGDDYRAAIRPPASQKAIAAASAALQTTSGRRREDRIRERVALERPRAAPAARRSPSARCSGLQRWPVVATYEGVSSTGAKKRSRIAFSRHAAQPIRG